MLCCTRFTLQSVWIVLRGTITGFVHHQENLEILEFPAWNSLKNGFYFLDLKKPLNFKYAFHFMYFLPIDWYFLVVSFVLYTSLLSIVNCMQNKWLGASVFAHVCIFADRISHHMVLASRLQASWELTFSIIH